MIAVQVCPVCSSSAAGQAGVASLLRCSACGTVRSPSVEDPAEVYGDGYHDGQDGFFVDTDAPGLADYLQRAYRTRLSLVIPYVPGDRWLDVGCGRGDFLDVVTAAGWSAQGVELVESAAAVARSRGRSVQGGALMSSGLDERSFDVVSALHVVEHVLDVPAFLRSLAAYVKPGGHVVVEVPNYDALLRRRTGAAWPHLRAREHVSHFTRRTLTDALVRAGLTPVSVCSPSYSAASLAVGQALTDVGLRALARPATDLDRTRLSPVVRRGVRALDRGLSRGSLGVVLLAVARVP